MDVRRIDWGRGVAWKARERQPGGRRRSFVRLGGQGEGRRRECRMRYIVTLGGWKVQFYAVRCMGNQLRPACIPMLLCCHHEVN